MGNGTVASKFKLTTKVQLNQSNLRTPLAPKPDIATATSTATATPRTHPTLDKEVNSLAATASGVTTGTVKEAIKSASAANTENGTNTINTTNTTNTTNTSQPTLSAQPPTDPNTPATAATETATATATTTTVAALAAVTTANSNTNTSTKIPQPSSLTAMQFGSQPTLIKPKTSATFATMKQKSHSPEIESLTSHHPSNCNRCYRLKKKCTRTYPKCSHCERTNSLCEYVDRSKKRRKIGEEFSNGNLGHSQISTISHVKSNLTPTKHIAPNHKQMSVSSLLSTDSNDDQTRAREIQKNFKVPTAALASSARRAREKEKDTLVGKLNHKSTQAPRFSNLNEEFISIKAITTDPKLPVIFALNYFENFGNKYPFINKVDFLKKLDQTDFSKDSIVNLDVYILLSIGCILHDMKCLNENFKLYFKTKNIESVLDVLDLSFATYNPEQIQLLLLLCIYGVTSFNIDFVWNLIGILNRAVVKFELYKKLSEDPTAERIFWSVHNLEKEVSLLLRKPSLFLKYEYFSSQSISKLLYEDENLSLINHYISLGKFHDSLIDSILKNSREKLTEISSNIGNWVGALTKDISLKFVSQPALQDLIPFANVQSYYLQTEIDQISTTKSFMFPSQFIFYSLTMLISALDKSNTFESKPNTKITLIASGFWYLQLFTVIQTSIDCLKHFIEAKEAQENVQSRINEFNGISQQAVNLLKYIRGNKTPRFLEGYKKLDNHVDKLIETLESLGIKLLARKEDDTAAIINTLDKVVEEVTFKI